MTAFSPLPVLISLLTIAGTLPRKINASSPAAASGSTAFSRQSVHYDLRLSMPVGAQNLLTGLDVAARLEDRFLPPRLWSEDGFLGKTGGVGYRLGKLALLEQVFAVFPVVLQHEYFGHGHRAREFGYLRITYGFDAPWPFGEGGGSTSYHYPEDREKGSHELLAMDIGGIEANSVLGRELVLRSLERKTLSYREALLYLTAQMDLANYVGYTVEAEKRRGPLAPPEEGNDILGYLRHLNESEGYRFEDQYPLKLENLEDKVGYSALNPFYWYSFWTLLKTYLWSGRNDFAYPMLPLGPVRYLPALRVGLSPFGMEYTLDNYFVSGGRVLAARYRWGDGVFHRFWGAGVQGRNGLRRAGFALDADFDIWNQPDLVLGGKTASGRASGWTWAEGYGGAVSMTVRVPLWGRLAFSATGMGSQPVQAVRRVGLQIQGGYKSAGHLPGEDLDSGAILRAGIWAEGW